MCADGIFTPKELDSTAVNQFRPISVLNVEGKVFFSVLARRLANFLQANGYVDSSIQKAGIPGFPGCLEHVSCIWAKIIGAKKDKGNLHVVWLDLANAYGSVPHGMLYFALEFFHVPGKLRSCLVAYFDKFRFRFSASDEQGWCALTKELRWDARFHRFYLCW